MNRSLWHLAPWAVLGLVLLPILAGLGGTLAPLRQGAAWARLMDWPGLGRSVALSLTTGVGSTLMALALTLLIVAALSGSRSFALLRRVLSPLLALPHAAAALGLAFLVAPSGWLVRMLSPWATGWTVPPDVLVLNDPAGLALTLGLVAKELPFLVLMALAALPHCDSPSRARVAASLGYGRTWGFVLTTAPALYRSLRLPAFAVLAYAMTSVDMGAILGPDLPPPLSVQITRWMTAARADDLDLAAAGAVLQLGLVAGVLALWLAAERGLRPVLPWLAMRGARGRRLDRPAALLARGVGFTLAASLGAGMAALALWSLAGPWAFPDALPDSLTLTPWTKAAPGLIATSATTLAIALAATLAALALTLLWLEAEQRLALPPARAGVLIYLPLLVPQIAFLPGLSVAALHLGLDGGPLPVTLAHMVFVLPYVFLSLAPAFRGFDSRLMRVAMALGASPARVFWHLRLPMLLSPLLTAFAVGMAVSIGQYLPTLLMGGGRVETLTTEAVALASGGNRRLTGAVALLQSLLPVVFFALALALPRLVWANRRTMRAEAAA